MPATLADPDSTTVAAAANPPSRARQHFPVPLAGAPSYLLGERFAAGGMGAVHLGLKFGALGFQRLVAIKRMHAHLVQDLEFVTRFKDEIRLVSRLSHQNVVQTLDVIEADGELSLIMEYIEGETLHDVLRDAERADFVLPVLAAVGIVNQALHGLHAAHEATDDLGNSLNLVHRDVSPQNLMVGKDGQVKVLDFGVAKATSEWHVTRTGEVSGKVAYMSPEQAMARPLDRRSDVFAAGVVLWEVLTGQRLFRARGVSEGAAISNLLSLRVRAPSELRQGLPPALDRIVLRALEREPARRFGSARDFALALEEVCPGASVSMVANALADVCSERMLLRAQRLSELQTATRSFAAELTTVGQPNSGELLDAVSETGTLSELLGKTGAGPQPALVISELELQTQDLNAVLIANGVATARTPPRSAWRFGGVAVGAVLILLLLTRLWAPPRAPLERSAETRTQALAPERTLAPRTPEAPVEPEAPAPQAINADAQATGKSSPEPRPVRRRPAKPSSRATSVSCSPPSVVDAEGIRHFKPECL